MEKVRSNLHTHTTYSDGEDCAEDYILQAIAKGFRSIGFSEHAYNSYDLECRIEEDDIPKYLCEIRSLQKKYRDQIEVYLGIENDYFEPMDRSAFQFVIGSSHFLLSEDGEYFSIDNTVEILENAARAFGGFQSLATQYYKQVSEIALTQKPDILGHLDLLTKLNRNNRFFDTGSSWYRGLLDDALDAVTTSGVIVEINSGGIFRGKTSLPYPSGEMLKRMNRAGVPVTISSDAHCTRALDFYFDEMAELLREAGYKSRMELRGGVFCEEAL